MKSRVIAMVVYVGVALCSAVMAAVCIYKRRLTIATDCPVSGKCYLVVRHGGGYYFISDFSYGSSGNSVLYQLLEETKCRVFWDNESRMIPCFMVSRWYPESFFDDRYVKFGILDDAPLDPFSKSYLRELYYSVLQRYG